MGQTSQEQNIPLGDTIENDQLSNIVEESDDTINKWQNVPGAINKLNLIDSNDLTESQAKKVTKLNDRILEYFDRIKKHYNELFIEQF